MSNSAPSQILNTRKEWKEELAKLPTLEENGGKIPSVFLAHGQPMLIYPPHLVGDNPMISALGETQGPGGLLCHFLEDFGPVLIEKYRPRAIVVLSAHYETEGGGSVTDYGNDNPLLYDYFGFPDELYQVKFQSSGDPQLARQIVELLQAAGIKQSKLTSKLETRGRDGRGFDGPGLDHGVFVPFKLMFGENAPVPIVQVSIPSDLSPQTQRSLGEALEPLRSEGILVISGGLTIHTFRDFSAFSPATAKPLYHSFESSIISALSSSDYSIRTKALDDLTQHPGFRSAHPREEHFVPIYVAAGAAKESEEKEGKKSRIVCGLYGAKTVLFGV
ncbi:DODA-type extradiol aromatic ring-opening family dioxygenase [Sporobolomyces salmoneus]|uniref:DODA-type extradiol aromatic ring-opening family dioxygenase n=1 Tax=Sporobolomyces salmoneus TaxID=183962 RepID=UPI00316EC5B9